MPIWHRPNAQTFVLGDDTHVWRLNLELSDNIFEYIYSLLTDEEKGRAARFYFEKDRNRFVAARGQVKNLIAKYLNRNPQSINFVLNEHGKPYCKDKPLFFNLSHSHKLGLMAINKSQEVGVDIEWKRPNFDNLKIARRFFSPAEQDELFSLPESDRIAGFFNAWSRKEAFIKAVGLGLSMPLKSFDVTLNPNRNAQLLEVRHAQYRTEDWELINIPAHEDYASALVVKKPCGKSILWDLTENDVY